MRRRSVTKAAATDPSRDPLPSQKLNTCCHPFHECVPMVEIQVAQNKNIYFVSFASISSVRVKDTCLPGP